MLLGRFYVHANVAVPDSYVPDHLYRVIFMWCSSMMGWDVRSTSQTRRETECLLSGIECEARRTSHGVISGTEVRSSVCAKYIGLEGSRITGRQGKPSRSREAMKRVSCKRKAEGHIARILVYLRYLMILGVLCCKLGTGRQLKC